MIFMKQSEQYLKEPEGVEVHAVRRRRPSVSRSDQACRLLRDRAFLLFRWAGLTMDEIMDIVGAIRNEPASRGYINGRILEAESLAKRQAEERGLLRSSGASAYADVWRQIFHSHDDV